MRFIHTGDWHLGRLFHSVHLTDDQRFALDGLIRLADECKADAVVVAGDVFDRAVPPTDAVDLLDEVVAALALDLGIAVIMIAGNHDSPARLEYFSELARRAGVHVVGRVGATPQPVEVEGAGGTSARFWPLAYTDPETARYELGRDDIHSHQAVVEAQLEAAGAALLDSSRNVLVGHAFVSGCRESESERPLTVGGSGAVDPALFAPFDYVALGHLHEPQQAASERLRYGGSLLKYSFSEADHRKSVTIVDLASDGSIRLQEAALPLRRDVRQIRGEFEEIMDGAARDAIADAYVEIVLTDADPVLNAADRLRPFFPYLLSLRRERPDVPSFGAGPASAGVKSQDIDALFADFFQDVTGSVLTDAQQAELSLAISEMERDEREVAVE